MVTIEPEPGDTGPSAKRAFIIKAGALAVALMIIIAVFSLIISNDGSFPFMPGGDGHQPVERSEWAYEMTQAKALNLNGLTGKGITICIVDSGIDITHPDLDHVDVVEWKDYVNGRSNPYDDDGHGTAMAGLIYANGIIKGAAYDAKLMAVKALNSQGEGSSDDVAEGIRFCMDPNGDGNPGDGADIISLSLSGPKRRVFGTEVGQAATEAANAGIFVVASAGNDGQSDDGDVESPASEPLIIAVGAIDENKARAPFSSRGDNDGRTPLPFDDRKDPNKKPEIVAPGVKIVTTNLDDDYDDLDGNYAYVSGTSPSAALVSGVLALLLQSHPEYRKTGSDSTVTDLKGKLMGTCEKLPGQMTPHDDWYGYGLIRGLSLDNNM